MERERQVARIGADGQVGGTGVAPEDRGLPLVGTQLPGPVAEMGGEDELRVLVDGKKAWESAVVRGGDPPIDLPAIELAGASELVLEVDTGPESFLGDRADWLELLVVK